MELSISHDDFRENKLAYRRAGVLTCPGIFQNGKKVKIKRGKFRVTKDDGHEGELRLKRKWTDPVPVILWDSQEIRLVRPFKRLEWIFPGVLICIALLSGHYVVALLGLILAPHLADAVRNDGSGSTRFYIFGLKAGLILTLFAALAWLTYPRISH